MPTKTESGHHQTKADFPTTQPAVVSLVTCTPEQEQSSLVNNNNTTNFLFENLNDGAGEFVQFDDRNGTLSQFWSFREAGALSPQRLPSSQTLLFHHQHHLQETMEHYESHPQPPAHPQQELLPIAPASVETTSYARDLVLGKRGNSDYSWDIKDIMLPDVTSFDPYELWPEGNCRRVYSMTSERARRHQSGWAMRNTNNHNPQVLKKSCLGVLVCSANCTSNGQPVAYRPAICDKARKKQCMRSCTTNGCNGHLVQKYCKGHGGYPVTHFWRFANGAVFFQGKGRHDHVRPTLKALGEREVRGGTRIAYSPSDNLDQSPGYQSAFSDVESTKRGNKHRQKKLFPTITPLNPKITSAFRHEYSTRSGREMAKHAQFNETVLNPSQLIHKQTMEPLLSVIPGDVNKDIYPLIQSQVGEGGFLDSTQAFYENHQNNEQPLQGLLEAPWNSRFHVSEQLSFTTPAPDSHQEHLETSYLNLGFQDPHAESFPASMEVKPIVQILPAPQKSFVTHQQQEEYPWRLPTFSSLVHPQSDECEVQSELTSFYCHNETGEICSACSEVHRGFNGNPALRMMEKSSDQPFLGMLFSNIDPNQQPNTIRDGEGGSSSTQYSSTDMSFLQQICPLEPSNQLPFFKKDEESEAFQGPYQQQVAYNLTPLNNQPPPGFYSTPQQQSEENGTINRDESGWVMTPSQYEDMKSWFPFVNASPWKPVETG